MYDYDYTVSQNQRKYYTSDGLILGSDNTGRPIRIPRGTLDGHMLVLGKTGTGKSTFLSDLITEISYKEPANIVLLDPHGTLQDTLIAAGIPRELMYLTPRAINLRGSTRAITLNPLALPSDDNRQVDKLVGWLRDTFAGNETISSGIWGPRLEVLFKVVLPELMRLFPGSNLLDFANTISDKNKMKAFLEKVEDIPTRKFIGDQVRDWRNWSEYISSTMNRLLPLLSNDSTRHFISGESDSVDIGSKLRSEKIFMPVDISKENFSPSSAKVVTSLVLMKLWTTLMHEYYGGGKIRTYIVIDEFQNIPASIIETLLSEGRKFGICLILATQFLPRYNSELTRFILGNVRHYVSFNISSEDSVEISRMVPGEAERKEFLETVKSQHLHSAVILSQLQDGLSGPLSFTPYHDNVYVRDDILASLKSESFNKFSTPILSGNISDKNELSKTDVPLISTSEKTLHEKILDEFSDFLLRYGIEMERYKRINKSIPDGIFSYSGMEYIVEVEVSDVNNKSKILKKMIDYSGRNLIFISQEGNARIIHDYVSGRSKFRIKDSLAMEVPTQFVGNSIYLRDYAAGLTKILLVERTERGFKAYWEGRSRKLWIKHLKQNFTFQRELNSGRYGEIKNYIFRLMVSTDRYALRKSDVLEIDVLSKGYVLDFINKFGRWDNGFITLGELFNM